MLSGNYLIVFFILAIDLSFAQLSNKPILNIGMLLISLKQISKRYFNLKRFQKLKKKIFLFFLEF